MKQSLPELGSQKIFDFVSFVIVLSLCLYLFFTYLNQELTSIHVIFCSFVFLLYFLHLKTRVFLILILPVVFQNIFYDLFRYVPFHKLLPIYVKEPYVIEQYLFGFASQGKVLLPHEFLLHYATPFLDVFGALVYNLLDPGIFILCLLLWKLRNKELAQRFTASFLVLNGFAFLTYYYFPTAAPWYVAKYGFTQPLHAIAGSAAGLENFDAMIGVNFSADYYSSNPVVFGAVPSMHAGFTMLSWAYSYFLGRTWFIILGIYALAMWFFALYLQHHYLIDVLLGIFYALVVFVFTEKKLKNGIQRIFQFLFKIFENSRFTFLNR